jgi:hypothetical protein
MMETIRSYDMSVLTRATRRNIPEDGIPLCLACQQKPEVACTNVLTCTHR